ncbi:MAG: hypothetical protein ACJAVD_000990 [Porticoccaceae bacterium]|jgi:hypothetical protein
MENSKLKSKITTPRFKNKHTDDLVDHYWGSIGYITALIKASELKAGILLSFYGILLNFIYQSHNELTVSIKSDKALIALIVLWVILTTSSILFCVRCFLPKIEGHYKKNMFFFKDIISKFGNIDQFSQSFFEISTDENQLFKQLGEQIFIISKIADWKFKNVKRAISLLACSMGVLFLIGGYLFIMTLF